MTSADEAIEQQLTVLLRRGHRIHLSTRDGDAGLDRAAYGTMCKLADDGPQRLAALAHAFALDPSTVTRQVKVLEEAGLAARQRDPTDGRGVVLDLTAHGRQLLEQTRRYRRERLHKALGDWSDDDLNTLGRLMREFNASLDRLPSWR
jgi:DNA-binding MarR family transcriptional regulator